MVNYFIFRPIGNGLQPEALCFSYKIAKFVPPRNGLNGRIAERYNGKRSLHANDAFVDQCQMSNG